MANNFVAPLRFTAQPEDIRVFRDEQSIHVVGYWEHRTLHFSEDTPQLELDKLLLQLQDINNKGPVSALKRFDILALGLKYFNLTFKDTLIMGDSKPGVHWEFTEDDERDVWKDSVSWNTWISQEYIAKEYYSREQNRR